MEKRDRSNYKARVANDKRKALAKQLHQERLASYEQYGSAEERAPYLEASIGRLVIGDQLRELAEKVGTFATLKPLKTHGITYLAGAEIAGKTKFGLLRPNMPRLEPEEVIEQAVSLMQQTNSLGQSSKEPITVPLDWLFAKIRRDKGFLLVARISDITTDEYPTAGLMQAEEGVVRRKFNSKMNDLTKPLPELEQQIPLAAGGLADDFKAFRVALRNYPVPDDISVMLGPVGYVHTPKIEYP